MEETPIQDRLEEELRRATDPPPKGEADPVWTYRGYRLRASEFTTAMVHFFRAEISRANVWRQRLDTTTNWAVLATAASLTYAFSQDQGYHAVIILNTLLVTLFLYIEARRYRYYELWSFRVRLMETDFFAAMLVPPFRPDPDWAESLAENLLHPDYPITMLEALGRRLRRNYLWIYAILAISWLGRIWLLPELATTSEEFFERAAIGSVAGEIVLAIGVGVHIILGLVALLTLRLHSASGEILPRYAHLEPGEFPPAGTEANEEPAWFRPASRRRKQLMALIITDQTEVVSKVILNEMSRGVTALPGTGMYTGKAHSVLMVALTVTEVNHLKALVHRADEKAFMIVSPVQEILGGGFSAFQEKKGKTQ